MLSSLGDSVTVSIHLFQSDTEVTNEAAQITVPSMIISVDVPIHCIQLSVYC